MVRVKARLRAPRGGSSPDEPLSVFWEPVLAIRNKGGADHGIVFQELEEADPGNAQGGELDKNVANATAADVAADAAPVVAAAADDDLVLHDDQPVEMELYGGPEDFFPGSVRDLS